MGLLAFLAPFIPQLIQLAEKALHHPDPNVKMGPDKIDLVTQLLQQLAAVAVSSKLAAPPAAPITTDTYHGIIETDLARMKASGKLDQTPQGSWFLVHALSFSKLEGVQ